MVDVEATQAGILLLLLLSPISMLQQTIFDNSSLWLDITHEEFKRPTQCTFMNSLNRVKLARM